MKRKAFVCLLLAIVFQLNTVVFASINTTFSCHKENSDVVFQLVVTNEGPDTVPKGRTLYYFYKTSENATPIYGSKKLTSAFKKGQTLLIYINAGWQTPVVSCGVSVTPYVQKAPQKTPGR